MSDTAVADADGADDTDTHDTPADGGDASDSDDTMPDARDTDTDTGADVDSDVPDGDIDTPDTDVDTPDTDIDGSDAIDGWIEIGTGIDNWVSIEDGSPLMITAGIQGGYHVWGAVRGQGFGPDDVEIEFSAHDSDDTTVAALYAVDDFVARDGALETSGLTVFISPDYERTSFPEFGSEEGWSDEWTLCGTVYVDGMDGSLEQCSPVTVVCCEYL